MSLAEAVDAFLVRHGLVAKLGVVGVSGGPDSVVLAHVLTRGVRSGHLPGLVLAHLNHQLRGDESDADQTFVQSLPESWNHPNLEVRTHRVDVRQQAEAEQSNLEAAARSIRYAWLTEVAREVGAAWIATGHTRDDQAETVLFRVLRGTGLAGLASIAASRPLDDGIVLVRPLLDRRRREILDYATRSDLTYRVDSSNLDIRFTRNRIRLELLPGLEQTYNVGVVDALASLADQAHEWAEELTRLARDLLTRAELPPAGTMRVFRLDTLKSASALVVAEMFRLVWRREAWPMGEMGRKEWKLVHAIVVGELSAWDFPGSVHVRRVGGVIQITLR